jgi:hypothetical protein
MITFEKGMAISESSVWNDTDKLMCIIEILLNSTVCKAAYYVKFYYLLTAIAYMLCYFIQFWVILRHI